MAWAKFDDRFWSNQKVRRAWKASRASIGLHVMAITYCAMHETDGTVDEEFVEMLLSKPQERDAAVAALVDARLWALSEPGMWVVNDYLEFNESRADADARRRRDSERKARGRNGRVQTESERNPRGVTPESHDHD